MEFEEFDEATIVTLADGDEPLRVSSFEEAFEGYNNARGKRQQKKQARQVARQQRKQAKIQAKAQTRAVKQQAKSNRKVGRQQVKANKKVAKQQKRGAKQVAKQIRKTEKSGMKQDRRDMKTTRRMDRKALRGGPDVAEELLEEEILDGQEAGAEELSEGAPMEPEEQDYAQHESPVADAEMEAQTEEEAESADENEEGGAEEEESAEPGEDDWAEGDYEDDGDVDETEYGFNGDMDEASCFDAGMRAPDPKVRDAVNRIERNKFRIWMLERKMNAQGGDQIAMAKEASQRKDRIGQLLEKLKGYFSNAAGRKGGKRAAKAEVKAAKKAAQRQIKQQVQAQRAAKRSAPGPGPRRMMRRGRPAPPVTTVQESLDPTIGENHVDIPAESGESVENFAGAPEGIIARDDSKDYDAPKARVFELHSNASGKDGVTAASLVTFLGLAAVGLYIGYKL